MALVIGLVVVREYWVFLACEVGNVLKWLLWAVGREAIRRLHQLWWLPWSPWSLRWLLGAGVGEGVRVRDLCKEVVGDYICWPLVGIVHDEDVEEAEVEAEEGDEDEDGIGADVAVVAADVVVVAVAAVVVGFVKIQEDRRDVVDGMKEENWG